MCHLNKKQRLLFDFIMYHSMISRFTEDNNMNPIEPYLTFLSDGAGVRKSFCIKSVIEYLKRIMKYHGQKYHGQRESCHWN